MTGDVKVTYLIFVIFSHRHHFQLKNLTTKSVKRSRTDFATKQYKLNYLLTKAVIKVNLVFAGASKIDILTLIQFFFISDENFDTGYKYEVRYWKAL